MSIASKLAAAADLIEPEGAWTQRSYARNADDDPVVYYDEDAVCWCGLGAMRRVGLHYNARIAAGIEEPPFVHFNDAPGRTQAEVVAKLRELSAKAAEAGL